MDKRPDACRQEALKVASGAFLLSRLIITATAVLSVAAFGAGNAAMESRFRAVVHPFSGIVDSLLSPLAKWDAVWYLSIAVDGYGAADEVGFSGPKTVFFPLYPALVYLGGGFLSTAGALVAAYVVSLGAFFASLYLFYRLVELELARADVARTAVLLMALFPASLFFGAPYSESVFLLVSVAAFYAARTGRWALAGALGALASATRVTGAVLIVPLLLVYFYGPRPGTELYPEPRSKLLPRFSARSELAWLAAVPLGLLSYATYLHYYVGDALAFLHTQDESFGHYWSLPFGAVFLGAKAALTGLGSLRVAWYDYEVLFGFLLLAMAAMVGVFRRLPVAYGAYFFIALAIPLSYPAAVPLAGLPRYMSVLFPLFMWLAMVCHERRRWTPVALAVSAVLLMVLTARHSTWRFVA